MVLKRVMGKASFATLQDMSGQIQIYVSNDATGEAAHAAFKDWDLGDILGVAGHLFKTRTGERTINAATVRLLAKAVRPLPEKFHGLQDQEQKYRQRCHLDLLASEKSRRTFAVRSRVIQAMRSRACRPRSTRAGRPVAPGPGPRDEDVRLGAEPRGDLDLLPGDRQSDSFTTAGKPFAVAWLQHRVGVESERAGIREAGDDHFYGAWKGAEQGGRRGTCDRGRGPSPCREAGLGRLGCRVGQREGCRSIEEAKGHSEGYESVWTRRRRRHHPGEGRRRQGGVRPRGCLERPRGPQPSPGPAPVGRGPRGVGRKRQGH